MIDVWRDKFLRLTTSDHASDKSGVAYWREKIYAQILRVGLALAVVFGPFAIRLSFALDQIPSGVAILLSMVVFIGLVIFRNSHFTARAATLLGILMLQGVAVFASGGAIQSGLLWFFAATPVASLLIGSHAGQVLLGINLLLFSIFFVGLSNQYYWLPDMADFTAISWLRFGFSYFVANIVVSVPIAVILEGIANTTDAIRNRDVELGRNERIYNSLVQGMLEGVMQADLILDEAGVPVDFEYLEVNQAFQDLTGLKDVVGKRVSEVFPGFRNSNEADLQKFYEAAYNQKISRYESYFEPLDSWFSIVVYGAEIGKFTLLVQNITERKVSEKQIESLSRFPKENPFPVLRIREDFRIAYANGASTPLLKEWGRHIGELLPTEWHNNVETAVQSGEIDAADTKIGAKVFSLAFVPVAGSEYVNVYGADITKRVQSESRLRESEQSARERLRRLQALRTIDQAITSTLNLEEVLDSVLSETLTLLDVDATAVLLVDEDDWLTFSAGAGFNTGEINRSMVHVGEGISGKSAEELELHWVGDARDPSMGFTRQGLLQAEKFISYYAAPLVSRGSLLGILEAYKRDSNQLDEEAREFLVAIAGQASIAIEKAQLFTELATSKAELEDTYDRTLEGWVTALDLRDNETAGHTKRVSEMTLSLAKAVGVSEDDLGHFWRGALLHDVGKMAIPDEILLKPDALDEAEWAVMKRHPYYAYEWLKDLGYLQKALDIPYAHHEKWDGSGYPQGLEQTDIPLAARIFAVVDVYDALTSDRPYRKAWTREKTLKYIADESGKHFDPEIVTTFLEL